MCRFLTQRNEKSDQPCPSYSWPSRAECPTWREGTRASIGRSGFPGSLFSQRPPTPTVAFVKPRWHVSLSMSLHSTWCCCALGPLGTLSTRAPLPAAQGLEAISVTHSIAGSGAGGAAEALRLPRIHRQHFYSLPLQDPRSPACPSGSNGLSAEQGPGPSGLGHIGRGPVPWTWRKGPNWAAHSPSDTDSVD